MIGKIKVIGNIRHCIEYGLHDKRELTEEQKIDLSLLDGLQHKDRAEVLVNHKCAGNARELTELFSEVVGLNERVEKPLFHATLRLPSNDYLTPEQWEIVGQAWAEEFRVQDNQYLIILHKDTLPPHIHIIANRVGFDGKVASDSNDFRRMAYFCRKMEKQFNLTEVANPKPFLRQDQRAVPRQDQRKINLQYHIHQTLRHTAHFDEFKKQMEGQGYEVIKGRGIAFVDDKKVRVKGSEVGFSLARIEKMLDLNYQVALKKDQLTGYEKQVTDRRKMWEVLPPSFRGRMEKSRNHLQLQLRIADLRRGIDTLQKAASTFWTDLFKVEYQPTGINVELIKEAKRKRKKKRLR